MICSIIYLYLTQATKVKLQETKNSNMMVFVA